jgi:hypothetical protein
MTQIIRVKKVRVKKLMLKKQDGNKDNIKYYKNYII